MPQMASIDNQFVNVSVDKLFLSLHVRTGIRSFNMYTEQWNLTAVHLTNAKKTKNFLLHVQAAVLESINQDSAYVYGHLLKSKLH